MIRTLSITRPDDWHVHFRDGGCLPDTVPASARHFARALIMPNLNPALTTLDKLLSYHQRILTTLGPIKTFTPYLTFYLNESVTAENLQQIKHYPFILGGKLYPAGATTNSLQGVRSIHSLYPLFEVMQDEDVVLQIHGEVTHGDIFEREALFIKEYLRPLVQDFPKLRMVLEHISTRVAVDFVMQAPKNIAATITPHHLKYNRNQLLAGGIKPHYYCLPILKHERDQLAIQEAVVSGNPKFFAGTDSAPHTITSKENACGCAGIFSAPFAVALYADIFAKLNCLNKLNDFMGSFGANFYQLPITDDRIELIEQPQMVPLDLPFGLERVVPIAAGERLTWSIRN